jgi:iron complex outermembrane receptor protein
MNTTNVRRSVAASISIALAAGVASALTVSSAWAQQDQPQRVTITGSNIPRTEAEGVSPLQTITREEIERSGVTTATELVDRIGSSMSSYAPSQALGDSAKPGFSGASLRGLGGTNTLILLNGRRIANYAFDSGQVDLNTIPLSAIERVEILLDGASAIYGTDAIGGVINFITRTNYTGAEVMAFADHPVHQGGQRWQTGLAGGMGNLQTDGFNLFGSIDYQKMQTIHSIDRPFSKTAYLPQYGVDKLSSRAFPANISTAGGVVNPALATGCLPPISLPVRGRCRYDYASQIDIAPPQEKWSTFFSGGLRVNPNMQLFGELNYVRNVTTFAVSQTPVDAGVSFTGTPLIYPAGGPFYPTGLGLAGDLRIAWRAVTAGRRTDEATSEALRAVGGIKGLAFGWDYNVALSYNQSKATDKYVDGWLYESKLYPAMRTGLINPWGPQTPGGQALLDSTKITGVVREATGKVPTFDIKATRDLMQMPAGPLGLALGAELRQEKFVDDPKPVQSSGDILGGGGNQSHQEGKRDVKALYAEVSVPIVKTLEGTAAVRTDNYSDVGSTTNPKVGFKWTPVREFGLRGSYNTGFHAPALFDLYGPIVRSNTANTHNDPVRCPGGVPLFPATALQDCDLQFNTNVGGNKALTPEKSKQFSLGVILEPVRNLSMTVDYYSIMRKNTIGTLSDDLLFANPTKYAANFFRRADGTIDYVDLRTVNLGKIHTTGLDISLRAQTASSPYGIFKFNLNGNRVLKYDYQVEKDGDWFHNAGQFAAVNDGNGSTYRIVPRWRHYATGTWEFQRWALTLANSYTSSYVDSNANAGQNNIVGAYRTWDFYTTYNGVKNMTLIGGVRNLFDRNPPFTNSGQNFQVGFEPKFTNPAGRSIFGKLVWKFM